MEAIYHIGPLSQTELSNKVLRSGGNITLVIDNLEKRRLAQRTRNHATVITDEMSVLTPAEQEQLGQLCRKLGKRFEG